MLCELIELWIYVTLVVVGVLNRCFGTVWNYSIGNTTEAVECPLASINPVFSFLA